MYSGKNDLLTKAKDLLKEEMTSISYTTWVKNLEIKSVHDNKIVLIAQSTFQKEAIETRYAELIVNTFNFITNKNCEISVIEKSEVDEESDEDTDSTEDSENYTQSETYAKTFLNPKYTFDTFVVGDNNKFANAAALAVAEAPAASYNPLYIYGGVGLGKTHLMHAIGNKILQNNPNTKILYVTSEDFINELIMYIQNPSFKTQLFREKYRNIDVLLIDDIEFIAGKERGQEEFFHTFNHLHQNGKQVIISSDKPPRDIPLLEERLKTRLEWGLIADVSMPDYETRLAILRNKVQHEHIIIDDYILTVIATKINTNIRELEGTLNKIVAYAALTHSQITIELAEKSINEIVLQKEKVISASYIQDVVSKYFNIEKKDLLSTKKSNDIVYPRQIAMYLCRSQANISYPQIARDFGKKDHTTVMHACDKIEKEIKQNTNTKLIVDSLRNLIRDNQ